jgi:hypothetical protein
MGLTNRVRFPSDLFAVSKPVSTRHWLFTSRTEVRNAWSFICTSQYIIVAFMWLGSEPILPSFLQCCAEVSTSTWQQEALLAHVNERPGLYCSVRAGRTTTHTRRCYKFRQEVRVSDLLERRVSVTSPKPLASLLWQSLLSRRQHFCPASNKPREYTKITSTLFKLRERHTQKSWFS